MRHIFFISLLLLAALRVPAQTVLGKHPADTFTPGFFQQNSNAQKIASAVSPYLTGSGGTNGTDTNAVSAIAQTVTSAALATNVPAVSLGASNFLNSVLALKGATTGTLSIEMPGAHTTNTVSFAPNVADFGSSSVNAGSFTGNGANLNNVQAANGVNSVQSNSIANAITNLVGGTSFSPIGSGTWTVPTNGVNSTIFPAPQAADDWLQKSSSLISPANTYQNWYDVWGGSGVYIAGAPIWHSTGYSNEYVFNEGKGDPIAGYKSTGTTWFIPMNATQCVFSAWFKKTPEATADTSLQMGWVFSGFQGITLTSSYVQYFQTNNLTPGTNGTDLILMFYNGGFSMSNPAVVFYPPPTNAVLVNTNFSRSVVLSKNISGGTRNNTTVYPFKFQPSGGSTVEWDSAATNLLLEVNEQWTGAQSDCFVQVNNQPLQRVPLNSTPKIQAFPMVNLPAGNNHFKFYNSHSYSGGVNSLRAVCYPPDTTLTFAKGDRQLKVFVIGDSVADSNQSTNRFTYAFQTASTYCGIESIMSADGSVPLVLSSVPTLIDTARSAQPDFIWIEHGINNWNNNSLTNDFAVAYTALVDGLNRVLPGAKIIVQPMTANSSDGVANGNGNYMEDYRNLIRSIGTNTIRKTFAHVADPAGWFTTPAIGGFHPTQSDNMKYAWFIATNLEWCAQFMTPTNGVSVAASLSAANTFTGANQFTNTGNSFVGNGSGLSLGSNLVLNAFTDATQTNGGRLTITNRGNAWFIISTNLGTAGYNSQGLSIVSENALDLYSAGGSTYADIFIHNRLSTPGSSPSIDQGQAYPYDWRNSYFETYTAHAGFVSLATNTATIGSTGWTNTLGKNVGIRNFTGVSVVQTNYANVGFSRGTVSTAIDIHFKSGDYIIGTSCAGNIEAE